MVQPQHALYFHQKPRFRLQSPLDISIIFLRYRLWRTSRPNLRIPSLLCSSSSWNCSRERWKASLLWLHIMALLNGLCPNMGKVVLIAAQVIHLLWLFRTSWRTFWHEWNRTENTENTHYSSRVHSCGQALNLPLSFAAWSVRLRHLICWKVHKDWRVPFPSKCPRNCWHAPISTRNMYHWEFVWDFRKRFTASPRNFTANLQIWQLFVHSLLRCSITSLKTKLHVAKDAAIVETKEFESAFVKEQRERPMESTDEESASIKLLRRVLDATLAHERDMVLA